MTWKTQTTLIVMTLQILSSNIGHSLLTVECVLLVVRFWGQHIR